jgi:hypothetical protein
MLKLAQERIQLRNNSIAAFDDNRDDCSFPDNYSDYLAETIAKKSEAQHLADKVHKLLIH